MAYVYILASKMNGTLYIGVTRDLLKRVYEYKFNVVKGFTQKYGVHDLVYYIEYTSIVEAICSEKKLKNLRRSRKIQIIEKQNPEWKDLYFDLV